MDAREKGATGAVFRLDWESLDGHSSFFTPNKINVYAAAALTRDLDTPGREVYRTYLEEEGWCLERECGDRAAERFGGILGETWGVTARTVFVDGCVVSDSSVMPISLEHAVWLSEEKNSLRDWDESKWNCVSARRESVEAAIREKEEALAAVTALCAAAEECPPGIREEKWGWFKERLQLNARYVDMFYHAISAILLTRYVTETEENDEEYRREAAERARSELAEIKRLEREFRALAEETEYEPHVIYTLLDPDRLNCLYRSLRRKLGD